MSLVESPTESEGIVPVPFTGTRRSWSKWDKVVPSYIRSWCMIWQFIKFSFQFYLCTRQLRVLSEFRRVPRVLQGKLPLETFLRARKYQKELVFLEMFSCVYWIFYEIWAIHYAGNVRLWFWSGDFMEWLGIWPEEWDQETGETIVWISLAILLTNVVKLPLNLYRNFVTEEKFGFNKMSPGSYAVEVVKVVVVEATWTASVCVGILWIVRTTGKHFFIWVWLFCFIWLVGTVAVYPNVIAPIFNEYTSLREGRLRSRLHRLAQFVGFPLDDILVLHQNWKSEHRDAYFYGLGYTKRIVLFDTLLSGYPEADSDLDPLFGRNRLRVRDNYSDETLTTIPSTILHRADAADKRSSVKVSRPRGTVSRMSMYDIGFTEYEIEAIAARLMGHWVLSHSIHEMVFPEVSLFLFFLIFSYFYESSSLFQAFEVPQSIDKPIILGLRLLFLDVMDIYKLAVNVIMRHLARNRELESDSFATKLGYGDDLIDAIIELNKENLGYPYFDSWYWSYHFPVPSLLQRIEEIETEIIRLDWKWKSQGQAQAPKANKPKPTPNPKRKSE